MRRMDPEHMGILDIITSPDNATRWFFHLNWFQKSVGTHWEFKKRCVGALFILVILAFNLFTLMFFVAGRGR